MNKIFIYLGGHRGEMIHEFFDQIKDADSWKIYCFEPLPDLAESIRKLVSSLGYTNVEVLQKAIGTHNGKTFIYRSLEQDGAGSTTVNNKVTASVDYNNPIEVECVDIAKFIKEVKSDGDLVVIYCNIEGGEYEILNDLINSGDIELIHELYIDFHSHKFLGEIRSAYEQLELQYMIELTSGGEYADYWVSQWKDYYDTTAFVENKYTTKIFANDDSQTFRIGE